MFNALFEVSENGCAGYEVYGWWEPQTEEYQSSEPEPMDISEEEVSTF